MFYRSLSFLIVFNSLTLFSQPILKTHPVFYPDFQAFLQEPEFNFYPNWVLTAHEFEDTKNLLYMSLQQVCVDSSFLIDTIYSNYLHSNEEVSYYRRSISYDEFFRINTIVADVQTDSNWFVHQITDISYNASNKIEQINYIRYEEPSDSLIIKYKYDDNGVLMEEKAESKLRLDSTWSRAWIKTYYWKDKKLIRYDYLNINKNYWIGPNRVEFNYNDKNLPIECIEYEIIDGTFNKENKHIWEYDVNNKLIKHIINKWEQSEWILIFSEFFEWDKYGRLKEQQQTTYETKDSLPFTYITEYLYSISNDSNLINIQLVINGYKSDSLNGKSYKIFENDTKGLLVSFLSGNIYGGREVIIERDKYFNVISVRDKNWQQEKWKYEEIMNVIYRKKEH